MTQRVQQPWEVAHPVIPMMKYGCERHRAAQREHPLSAGLSMLLTELNDHVIAPRGKGFRRVASPVAGGLQVVFARQGLSEEAKDQARHGVPFHTRTPGASLACSRPRS